MMAKVAAGDRQANAGEAMRALTSPRIVIACFKNWRPFLLLMILAGPALADQPASLRIGLCAFQLGPQGAHHGSN